MTSINLIFYTISKQYKFQEVFLRGLGVSLCAYVALNAQKHSH